METSSKARRLGKIQMEETPQALGGREVPVYTHEELIAALNQMVRDRHTENVLLHRSRRYWTRGSDEGEDLLQQAIVALLASSRKGNPTSKDQSLISLLSWKMRNLAIDMAKRLRIGEIAYNEAQRISNLRRATPYEKEVVNDALELAGQREAQQRAVGKSPLPVREYFRLRFAEGLEGEDVRAALGLDQTQFDAVTKQATRLYREIEESMEKPHG